MADGIHTVIEKLELKDVTLAEFSIFGAIAVRYIARHKGHNVSKSLLFGAAAPIGIPHSLLMV
ncbi:Arylesterase [compost metagenome]